jgi:hypothetical protein
VKIPSSSTLYTCIGDGRLRGFASGEAGGEQRDGIIVEVANA